MYMCVCLCVWSILPKNPIIPACFLAGASPGCLSSKRPAAFSSTSPAQAVDGAVDAASNVAKAPMLLPTKT